MGYQYVIDNAQTIFMNRTNVIASTQTRDGTVRQVNRGANYWSFEVTLAPAPYSDVRSEISFMENLRSTAATENINLAHHPWMSKYQGDAGAGSFYANFTKGNNYITLTAWPTITSGYKFLAGDLIQLGSSGKVYVVTAPVFYTSNTVYLHRPILDNTGSSVQLSVGSNVYWNVICTQFPKWTITERNIVTWSGPFIFAENLT